jgi:hypothetical protein
MDTTNNSTAWSWFEALPETLAKQLESRAAESRWYSPRNWFWTLLPAVLCYFAMVGLVQAVPHSLPPLWRHLIGGLGGGVFVAFCLLILLPRYAEWRTLCKLRRAYRELTGNDPA